MTRLDPNLRLSRLVVLRDGHRAYDEEFHNGVNIIRGVPGKGNSVGKSTIADLIFYALGGDFTDWKHEASLCDTVYAETVLSGATVTLRREITDSIMQPMWIFYGDFEAATLAGADGWQRYTYTRVSERESFTQVLFRILGLPEVPAEANANITMHQLLRLMYVDQMTPVDRIFRFESRDSALRRQAVGDLVCGVHDERIYPAQLDLRDKEKSHEVATQQYNALHRVLAANGEGFNLDFVIGRQREVEAELERVRVEIQNLKAHRFDDSKLSADQAGAIAGIKKALDRVNADVTQAEIVQGQLTYAIEDAATLIEEIERTLTRLREGELAHGTLGPVDFHFCPSCFSPLQDAQDERHCKLCRSPSDPKSDQSRIARMRNELELQLKESAQLQNGRKEELETVNRDVSKLRALRQTLSREYLNLSQNYISETDTAIDGLTSRLGYLERELVEVQRERRIAEQLDALSAERAILNEAISILKSNIAIWIEQKDRRQGTAYQKIQSLTAEIIGQDVHTEDEFSASSSVYFNFSEDRITVNGKSGFSASSLTVLRNAFHLALHVASCLDSSFRYPRFLLMDNIEDKGMTEERSQNFQNLIVNISNQITTDHQIIFTTSMIAPELNESDLTVGELYSFENKSLKIGRPR